MVSFFPVSVHAFAAAAGHGVGRHATGGGLQDGLVHALVALHPRSSHALRLEKGEQSFMQLDRTVAGLP